MEGVKGRGRGRDHWRIRERRVRDNVLRGEHGLGNGRSLASVVYTPRTSWTHPFLRPLGPWILDAGYGFVIKVDRSTMHWRVSSPQTNIQITRHSNPCVRLIVRHTVSILSVYSVRRILYDI